MSQPKPLTDARRKEIRTALFHILFEDDWSATYRPTAIPTRIEDGDKWSFVDRLIDQLAAWPPSQGGALIEERGREIIKRIAGAALELAIMRHDLISTHDTDEDPLEQTTIDSMKQDVIDCMTGDETGCAEPEDLNAGNCELIWLRMLLTDMRVE